MSGVNSIGDKKYGIGTLALIISLFAIMVSFTYIGGKTIGQYIVGVVHGSIPSSVISIILFTLAGINGYKHKEGYGAKLGKNISLVFMSIILFITIMSFIF
ncbi:hypothetical protein C3495_07345 [Clostridiaceae bacterium 14S0207]|nr:hypothetical protein C3495_07345 [Clostridiaceae bacterium 14S0207]